MELIHIYKNGTSCKAKGNIIDMIDNEDRYSFIMSTGILINYKKGDFVIIKNEHCYRVIELK